MNFRLLCERKLRRAKAGAPALAEGGHSSEPNFLFGEEAKARSVESSEIVLGTSPTPMIERPKAFRTKECVTYGLVLAAVGERDIFLCQTDCRRLASIK